MKVRKSAHYTNAKGDTKADKWKLEMISKRCFYDKTYSTPLLTRSQYGKRLWSGEEPNMSQHNNH